MDSSLTPQPLLQHPEPRSKPGSMEKEEKFFPSGAIAFFIALVILCLVIWFGIYFLMIERT